MKLNDWIVASLNNPDFTPLDFKDIGMSLDNTLMLSMEDYMNSKFITENKMFQNNSGLFLKDKFEDYYKKKLADFSTFLTTDPSGLEFDMFDTTRFENLNLGKNVKVKNPEFKIERVLNPDRLTTGISGINLLGERKLTQSEIAQTLKIYDPSTDSFLDVSPNDLSFVENPAGYIKSLFSDPLVLATYDEDGTHRDPITGQMVKHKKGDYKLNLEGTYYTEKLNGRSLIGKLVLSAFDTITVDGEGINKYDFMDSDGLDKSVAGTVAKTVASVAPLFIPGVYGVYSAALIARETAKTLPMLGGMIGSLIGDELDIPVLNTIAAAIGLKFTSSTSEYSKTKPITFENLASMMADVATLWGQQKVIANSISSIRKAKDIATNLKLRRLGADASLLYMAIVSNTDVYESMLEHGTTKKEAAAVAFGSTLGMFGVDKYLGLGELFFDDLTTNAQRSIRNTFKKEADSWAEAITQTIKNPEIAPANKVSKLIKLGQDLGKGAVNSFIENLKYHSLSAAGKAFGEGLEEVAEEVVSDLSKQTYLLLGDLGVNTSTNDVGAWDNALSRYGMSFLGGALGGALFNVVNTIQYGKFKRDTTQDELIYLVRNNKTGDLIKELDKWRDKGKLGSTLLSATKYDSDSDGNKVYLTTDDKNDSQNLFVYNRIKESIMLLDTILNQNDIKLSEDALYGKLTLGDIRLLALKDVLKDLSYSTGYLEDFLEIVRNLVDAENDLKLASRTRDGKVPDDIKDILDDLVRNLSEEEKSIRKKNLDKLEKKVDELTIEKDAFINGEKSLPYTRMMLFAIDPLLNNDFLSMTFQLWVKNNHDKTINELTSTELQAYKEEYLKYKAEKQSKNLRQQFGTFLEIELMLLPAIAGILENLENLKKYSEFIPKLLGSISKIPVFTDKLDGETDEDVKNINIKLENETEEQFLKRQDERILKYKLKLNETINNIHEQISKVLDESGGYIDPINRRRIVLMLQLRSKDVLKLQIDTALYNHAKVTLAEGYDDLDLINNSIEEEIKKLKPDLSNFNEVLKNILDIVVSPIKGSLIEHNNLLKDFSEGIKSVVNNRLKGVFLDKDFDIDQAPITGKTLDTIINSINSKLNLRENAQNAILSTSSVDNLLENGVITEDLYKSIKDSKLIDPEDTILFDTTDYFNIDDTDLNALLSLFANTSDKESIDYTPLSDEQIDEIVKEKTKGLYDDSMQLLNTVAENIKNDPYLKLINDLNARVKTENPTLGLINLLALKLNKDYKNINNTLQYLYDEYLSEENPSNFILTDPQKLSLLEALYLINLALKYVYAASTLGNNPVNFAGHNNFINLFADAHKDVVKDFTPLPTIDSDVANVYLDELLRFNSEIELQINISDANLVNKLLKFLRAEKQFNKSRYLFFKVNRNAFKFNLKGKDIDLLEGFEKIPDADLDTDSNLRLTTKVENLIYDNVHKLLKSGVTLTEILKESGIIGNISDIDLIFQLKTSELDDTITYDKWTAYDKVMYLLSTISLRASDFNNFLRSRIDQKSNTIPLTIQEYVSRVAISAIDDNSLVLEGLNYINTLSKYKLPLLDCIVFVDGAAGVGKSTVIADNVASYVDSDNIWISGPEETQVKLLSKIIGRGESLVRTDLLSRILDPATYTLIMLDISKGSSQYFTILSSAGIDNTDTLIFDTSKLKFNEEKPPKLIIIDEITHFSNAELQILNAYAKKNNIKILGLGNSFLNGYYEGSCLNINREACFTLRPPRMIISLRDTNLQKSSNLDKQIALLRQTELLTNANDDPLIAEKINNIYSNLKNLNLKVFNLDYIHGDLLTQVLTPEDAKKLTKIDKLTSGETEDRPVTVGFIGDTNSSTYKTLKNAGIDPIVRTERDVLGLEFDYIVIDKNWNTDSILHRDTTATGMTDLYYFLQDLYTMTSRGKIASIVIDKGLSPIIGNNEELFTTATVKKLSVSQFRKAKILILDQLQKEDASEDTGASKGASDKQEKGTDKQEKGANDKSNPDAGPGEGEINPDALGTDTSKGKGKGKDEEEQPDDSGTNPPQKDTLEPDKGTLESNDGTEDVSAPQDTDEKDMSKETNLELKKLGFDYDSKSQDIEELEDYSNVNSRVYASASFSGFERHKDDNGKTYYTKPDDLSGIRKELSVFTDKKKLTDGKEIDALVTNLLDFKSTILSRSGWDSLPSNIQKIISKENYDNMLIKIELRPQDSTDTFVGFTGLQEYDEDGNSKMQINGLVYSVIAAFKNNNGEVCKITLGLMADPATYRLRAPEVLKDCILKEQDANEKSRLLDILDNKLTPKIDEYEVLINRLASIYNLKKPTGPMYFDVTANFNEIPFLRKAKKQVTLETYRKMHPYLRISEVNIYDGGLSDSISLSVVGKAVIFVSPNTRTDPSDLREIYMLLKEAFVKGTAQETSPGVRMLKLNPAGVSFLDLANPTLQEIFQSTSFNIKHTDKGDVSCINLFPFEREYMGSRMLVSLWNFRANLYRFLNEYLSFVDLENINDELMDKILAARTAYYTNFYSKNKLATDEDILSLALANGITVDLFKLIDKFNDSLANKVREFRLDGVASGNGQYIRKLTNILSDNLFYKDIKDPMGIYLTPDRARRFETLINSVFTFIIDPMILLKDTDGSLWPIDRLITAVPDKVNSLKGLIKDLRSHGNVLSVTGEDGTQYLLQYPDLSRVENIPILLTMLHKYNMRYARSSESGFDPSMHELTFTDDDNKKRVLNYAGVLNNTHVGTTIEGKIADTDLSDMFSLIFHGTTNKLSTMTKATDAYFKHGFFSDPMASESPKSKAKDKDKLYFTKCSTNERLLLVDAEVDFPTFTITINNLQNAINSGESSEIYKQKPVQVEVDKYLNLRDLLEELGLSSYVVDDAIEKYDTEEDIYKYVVDENNKSIRDEYCSSFNCNSVNLDTVIGCTIENGVVTRQTMRDFIQQEYNVKLDKNTLIDCRDKRFSVSLPDGRIITLTYNIQKQLQVENIVYDNQKILQEQMQKSNEDVVLNLVRDVINQNLDLLRETLEEINSFKDFETNYNKADPNYIYTTLSTIVSEAEDNSDLSNDDLDSLYNILNTIGDIINGNCTL